MNLPNGKMRHIPLLSFYFFKAFAYKQGIFFKIFSRRHQVPEDILMIHGCCFTCCLYFRECVCVCVLLCTGVQVYLWSIFGSWTWNIEGNNFASDTKSLLMGICSVLYMTLRERIMNQVAEIAEAVVKKQVDSRVAREW